MQYINNKIKENIYLQFNNRKINVRINKNTCHLF